MRYFVGFFITVIVAMLFGYYAGIHKATIANGWQEGNKFVLELEGQIYEWDLQKPLDKTQDSMLE